MSQTVFPFELVHPNIEELNAQIDRRSNLMYCVLIGILIIAIGALPIIKVEVSVQARGAIRDVQSNTPITSLIQGQVLSHNLIEDLKVFRGEKLISLNAGIVEDELEKIAIQVKEAESAQQDLDLLLKNLESRPPLRTSVYQGAFSQYSRESTNLDIKKQYALGVLERVGKLYKEQVVAKVEFEKAQLDADLAANELRLLEEQQRKTWEIEAHQIQQQLLDLRSKSLLLQRQSKDYAIYAPCDGILVQTSGLKPGSYVMPGQQLAFISTQDSLLAEVHIPSTQIGYIHKRMRVKLHIDAYNFHEWGSIEGTVHQVPTEVKVIKDIPVFVTHVILDKKELKLKNGYTGQLKKGMLLSARFLLKKRSLFALLYDKAEDWLDPRKI